MNERSPDTQLISNLIVVNRDGQVLFVRYDEEDDRWWLPGEDLEPYEHPDQRANKELARFGLTPDRLDLVFIESFRGRRGWHVVFHYRVDVSVEPSGEHEVGWFPPDDLPRTMHGKWERDAVEKVLAQTGVYQGRAQRRP